MIYTYITKPRDTFQRINSKLIQLECIKGGQKYKIILPVSINSEISMLGYRATLLKSSGKIDITMLPGIPYNFCANDLGGDGITIVDTMEEVSHEYDKHTCPCNCK